MKNKNAREGSKEWHQGLEVGDVLYESQYGYTVEVEIISEPVFTEKPLEEQTDCDTWRVEFTAKCAHGEIDYVISPMGLMYNCGRLYFAPAYAGELTKLDGTTIDQ